ILAVHQLTALKSVQRIWVVLIGLVVSSVLAMDLCMIWLGVFIMAYLPLQTYLCQFIVSMAQS
ncbi:hypothetical protein, partial [Stenotrophomonas maltophilia]|uniref:hypothetical protein n=1 Tax=Stenotrophomonas maltophilia TaxID=40324 RepID=UPI003CCFEF4D